MARELPRILSPNLGCPFILSNDELNSKGFDLVIAVGADSPPGHLSLIAHPSFPGEGTEFPLELKDPKELTEETLPPEFKSIDETRFLISTTLRFSIFAGQARFFVYRAKPTLPVGQEMFRKIGQNLRAALYDLSLIGEGGKTGTVSHSLCLRPHRDGLRFIHLTDLHVALRNDLYADPLGENIVFPAGPKTSQEPPQPPGPSGDGFNNFNENLRRFIRYANELADQGKIDFVLALGDLVDFLHHGFYEREDYGNNNFQLFRNLILGAGNEVHRPQPNPGLKVPVFTSTGNHDWRFFPYDIAVHHSVFGVKKEIAEEFGLFWANEQEEITQKVEAVYASLLREGSPISNRTWLGKLINSGLQRLQKWQVQLLTPLSVSALTGILPGIPWIGKSLHRFLGSYDPLLLSVLTLLVVPVAMGVLTGFIKGYVRSRIVDLLAIEAGWQALKDYFLTINPFFNYGFRVGPNYFLILDTGHDCLRAQYLWDDGDKKLSPLSIGDNTIGQSPDSMAFYDINEYYPYSQITWIDRLMQRITREARKENQPVRVFIGLHAPPANLSKKKKKEAEKEAQGKPEGCLLEEKRFNIRFGTINHFLSHFFHLCLGRIEQNPTSQRYLPVDMVLAGHAHWKLEFRLAWDEKKKGPLVYFGNFTGEPASFGEDHEKLRPFLFQTPACGPREDFSPAPPYFRRVEIDGQGKILSAGVMRLDAHGKAQAGDFPKD
jgi:hypothetical protein